MKHLIIVASLALLITGCATAHQPQSAWGTTSTTVGQPYGQSRSSSWVHHSRSQYSHRGHRGHTMTVPVIRAVPVTQQRTLRSDHCHSTVTQPQPGIGGAIVGGVIGAALGNRIGGGSGQQIATAAGAVAGAAVGHSAQNSPRVSEVCEPAYHTHSVVTGYRVTYRVHGREFTEIMHHHPGSWVTVRVGAQ